MNTLDFTVVQFARLLIQLPEHLPISDALEQADPQKSGRWWSSQREHMHAWFKAQTTTGSGGYTRETPNLSAKKTYNRLQCPEGLLWIAEALGANPDLLQQVATEALTVPRRSRSKFIRTYFPWSMIAELAKPKIR